MIAALFEKVGQWDYISFLMVLLNDIVLPVHLSYTHSSVTDDKCCNYFLL